MSHSTVTRVPFMHVTKSGHCAYCGMRLKLCGVCGMWYHAPTERKKLAAMHVELEKAETKRIQVSQRCFIPHCQPLKAGFFAYKC